MSKAKTFRSSLPCRGNPQREDSLNYEIKVSFCLSRYRDESLDHQDKQEGDPRLLRLEGPDPTTSHCTPKIRPRLAVLVAPRSRLMPQEGAGVFRVKSHVWIQSYCMSMARQVSTVGWAWSEQVGDGAEILVGKPVGLFFKQK